MTQIAKSSTPNRPTIHDVARLAGVSKSTVSRVLNNRGYASPETIEQVQKAIDELNYVPHASARNLVSRRTNALGLAVNDLATLFIPPMLSGIDAVARSKNYNLLIAAVGHLKEQPGAMPLGTHNTDGIIAFADSFSDKQLHQFQEQNFPFVLMHRKPPNGIKAPCVNIENTQATKELIKHLIEKHNRKNILFLRGPVAQQDSIERETGYRQAILESGLNINENLIEDGGFNPETSANTIKRLLASNIQFDAVFAGDDEAAVGVIRALKEHGLQVPDDVAVVGFDDDHRAADIEPPLTTIHVPFEEIGREAVKVLIDLIETGTISSSTLPTEIVLRKSCGC